MSPREKFISLIKGDREDPVYISMLLHQLKDCL